MEVNGVPTYWDRSSAQLCRSSLLGILGRTWLSAFHFRAVRTLARLFPLGVIIVAIVIAVIIVIIVRIVRI